MARKTAARCRGAEHGVAEISLSLNVGRAVVAPCQRGDARKDGTSRLSPFELTADMV